MNISNSIVKLYLCIGIVFTISILTWLMLTPSISDQLFILQYSLQRFVLIAIAGILFFVLLAGLIFSKTKIVNAVINWMIESKLVYLLSFSISTILTICFLGLIFNLYGPRTLFLRHLFPALVLLFLISLETFVFQHIFQKKIFFSTLQAVKFRLHTFINSFTVSYKSDYWKFLIVVFFLFLFSQLLIIAINQLNASSTDTWQIGDWLINYQGGFVRRGLSGEIILHLSHLLSINIVVLIVAIQLTFYLIYFISSLCLAFTSSLSPLNVMLIFSPAFLLFSLFNPLGSFRKEILFFALLSTLCLYLVAINNKISNFVYLGIGLGAVFLVLSHEMLAAYVPYLICAFIISDKRLTNNTKKVIISLFPAIVIAAILVVFGKGNVQNVEAICESLKSSAPSGCMNQGAIFSLGNNLESAHAMVLQRITSSTILVYIMTTLLGLVPIVLSLLSKPILILFRNKKMTFLLALLVLSAIIGSLPIFWMAVDYGRFICIHLTSLSLLALMIGYKYEEGTQKFSIQQIFPFAISFIFVISWRLIYAGANLQNAFPLFLNLFK